MPRFRQNRTLGAGGGPALTIRSSTTHLGANSPSSPKPKLGTHAIKRTQRKAGPAVLVTTLAGAERQNSPLRIPGLASSAVASEHHLERLNLFWICGAVLQLLVVATDAIVARGNDSCRRKLPRIVRQRNRHRLEQHGQHSLCVVARAHS